MANVTEVRKLIEQSSSNGIFGWFKKTTVTNTYSEFIEEIINFIPDCEELKAITFEVENTKSNTTINLLCTNKNIYVDDINFIKSSGLAEPLYRIPLKSISNFSFSEGLVFDDLKFTQNINEVSIDWHWAGQAMSSPFFKKFAYEVQQTLVNHQDSSLTSTSPYSQQTNIEKELTQLKKMFDAQLISEEEYSMKKKKILNI